MQKPEPCAAIFDYRCEPSWPPLAWLAVCRDGDHRIVVRHGADVETRPESFCEAVWDGDFSAGGFDQTENVFGSGARLREDKLVFVSSFGTCDRLQYLKLGETWYVSNSLVCLSAALNLQFDPWYPWHYEDIASICAGIDSYKSGIRSSRGDVQLVYHRNLVWDGRCLREVVKSESSLNFGNYRAYRSFLETVLMRLADNGRARKRRVKYAPISTCSSGYDSLAVTALSRVMGNREVICVPHDRIARDDSGAELVRCLDMEPLIVARDAWRQESFAEAPFVAADACGRDVWIAGAQEHLRRRLLLTGQRGGPPWHWPPTGHGADFRRTDPGGLSLTEYRLELGLLHCPVPMIGTRATGQIHAISASDEMGPWRLKNDYDRPIARRIIEEAGIARGSFATRKTATAVHLFRRVDFDRFMPGTPSFRDFLRWLREESRNNPAPKTAAELTTPAREPVEVPLFRHLFPWALLRQKRIYLT